jgi:hypothetical protein
MLTVLQNSSYIDMALHMNINVINSVRTNSTGTYIHMLVIMMVWPRNG